MYYCETWVNLYKYKSKYLAYSRVFILIWFKYKFVCLPAFLFNFLLPSSKKIFPRIILYSQILPFRFHKVSFYISIFNLNVDFILDFSTVWGRVYLLIYDIYHISSLNMPTFVWALLFVSLSCSQLLHHYCVNTVTVTAVESDRASPFSYYFLSVFPSCSHLCNYFC